MYRIVIIALISLVSIQNTNAQTSELPYAEIPQYADSYSAGTVVSRMIDGLGFRFYWATDSLREEDLNYRPGDMRRSTLETVDHIYEMSFIMINAFQKDPQQPDEGLTFEQKRTVTLHNLKKASDIAKNSSDEDFKKYVLRFGSGSEYPFWNLINGPIADAIWHCGQIVSYRRSSGNPFNSNVSVFNGRLRNK